MEIINTFKDEDLPFLYSIEKACFDPTFRWDEARFRVLMKAAREKQYVWIIKNEQTTAGFLLANEDHGKICIETVDIAPEYWRKGLATKLINACEKDSRNRGFKEMKLEVWTDNPAQILYFNLGYRVCGFRRNYYKLHSHAISMLKKL